MKKALSFLLSFLVSAAALSAQDDTLRLGHSVSGVVLDGVRGRPLASVHVSVPDRNYATVTNADGEFSIKSDIPISEVVFSYVGYRTLRQRPAGSTMKVRLIPESIQLDESSIITGDPGEIVRTAISLIPKNYPDHPELLECFYRETLQKKNRYIYISEAVARIYKTTYNEEVARDRAALEKSRVLLSSRKRDTLSVKMQGGPTQAVFFDVVKNPDIMFDQDEIKRYSFTLGNPAYIDDRLQFVIHFRPTSPATTEWALYSGTLYIDRETLSFTRIEMSLDVSNTSKAMRVMVVRKPLTLRFTPKELSVVLTYRFQDGVSRLSYFRNTMQFNCDWRRRLFSTSYTAVNELVVTDLREEAVPIPRSEMFRASDVLSEKAVEFQDPDFWKDYNIIEPTESLEHAIGRLRKGR